MMLFGCEVLPVWSSDLQLPWKFKLESSEGLVVKCAIFRIKLSLISG